MIINVIVAEKNAIAMPHEALVCGNSDYVIEFQFDAEWDQHPTKTARFIFDDRKYTDVVFTGTQCPVPTLNNTHEVIVGVFAGNLKTTTPAYLRAQRSILCYGGEKAEFSQEEYDAIMARVNVVETIAIGVEDTLKDMNGSSGMYIVRMGSGNKCDRSQADILKAVASAKTCLLVNPIGYVYTYCGKQGGAPKFVRFDCAPDAINTESVVIDAEGVASCRYDTPAKTPNPYALNFTGAVEVSYNGSKAIEVEIPEAPEIPSALPNPHKLILSGAVDAEYDGGAELRVEIPTGVKLTVDADGNATI